MQNSRGIAKNITLGIIIFALGLILLAVSFTHGVTDTAKTQLSALQKGKLVKAYSLTSKPYQEKLSFNQFQNFVNQNPILKNHIRVKFTDRKIEGTIGYLMGTLEAIDHTKMAIEYQFIKENNKWKVQSLRLSSLSPSAPIAAVSKNIANTNQSIPTKDWRGASIQGILVSDTADKKGFVDIEKILISKNARQIFATVQIITPQKGTTITANLINSKTKEKIATTTDQISGSGDSIKALSFSLPNNQPWPIGDFEVNVSLSSGAVQSATFKIQ